MAYTDINSEDRLVQQTFADYLHDELGWESVYAYNQETFGPDGTLGRANEREVVLTRDLRAALKRLNHELPEEAIDAAVIAITQFDFTRSTLQHNRDLYALLRDGVPVAFRDERGQLIHAHAQVIDFHDAGNNRFLAVRELKVQGLTVPHYNRRADLVCFVNGLPLVFFELKAVYKNIRAGFDGNISDYFDTVPHVFFHNAFLVVSNGDRARYGSITSKWDHFAEWKRNDERECGRLEAKALLDGMLVKDRLLDLVENFILFDDSRAGGTRKVVARNHQVLGVNNAVASVVSQEALKQQFPLELRIRPRKVNAIIPANAQAEERKIVPLLERAHPELGRLGVFWHTQGSGKSYSMVFFAEKVRRSVPGNFSFIIMTDRDDLDDQIYRTFVGSGAADENAPRAGSGAELKRILQENHRYVFSLIHKFNQDVKPDKPYSARDDIIVISDEAHRTQAGKLARNMRLALPNAAFIGFTGTPLFKHDELTRRIFGEYVSRYDFKRSEEDGSTVRLVYENRGEKLGLTRVDLNDNIYEKIEEADLDPDQQALLEKLMGKDYEVITADDRLDKIADDFVEHCSTRWEAGKCLLVCIDKVTCGRMYERIRPRWQDRTEQLRGNLQADEAALAATRDVDVADVLRDRINKLRGQITWMAETLITIVISEGQNEVRDFAAWNIDIRPYRDLLKRGFETPDGKRVTVEDAFKDPEHPFRVAIVCAMWLTGFDVECLSAIYMDKPMRAHTLMQAIARANRVYPGKACGVIVDYNGMLKSLREALAQYALGDDDDGGTAGDGGNGGGVGIVREALAQYALGDDDVGTGGGVGIVDPIEEMVTALEQALAVTEAHLVTLGFDAKRLDGAKGFDRIEALRDAVEALYTTDEDKRRFEIMARQVFSCFKVLLMEPSAYAYAEQHDNIEAIYKKLQEKRDTADVTDLLKKLHRIVNAAIRAHDAGTDQAEGLTVDLSKIDFEELRDEFQRRVHRKKTLVHDLCAAVEARLLRMIQQNPLRMDYFKKYQEIVADYNREKDRATVEETFRRLIDLAKNLDSEQQRAVKEGLSEEELALFDLLYRDDIGRTERERLKQASRELLANLEEQLQQMTQWTKNPQTQAIVETLILDHLFVALPRPPFTEAEVQTVTRKVYDFIWQQSVSGHQFAVA